MANKTLPVLGRIFVSDCASKLDAETPTGCQVSFWFIRTFPFILLIVGTIGNILNVVVLSRQQLKKIPSTIFLLTLACSDTITLWIGLLQNILIYGWGTDIRDMSVFFCVTQEYTKFSFGVYSIWVMAAISIERMLRTKFPVTARSKITPRNITIVCIVLFILSALLHLHLPIGKTFQDIKQVSHYNDTEVKVISSCTYVSAAYLEFHVADWSLIQFFANSLGPTLVLFFCNAVTISVIVMQRKRIQPTGNNPTSNTTGRDDRSRAITRMVFLIALYYLLTSIPFNIYLNYVAGLPKDTSDEDLPNIFLAYIILNMISYSNFAFNFFFYFGSGPMFKRELLQVKKQVLKRIRRKCGLPVTDEANTETITTSRGVASDTQIRTCVTPI